ncbi:hypothetical protein [Mucilaginibacter dorajii]|uniref:Uncharacterized protein n=1 Tax=Mucilaginibacter dorajii TaxID=692994 RepID=A0ABP7R9T5_9SPHI|nr:hypothetical protein [Mucilaginibacter dorajii]MCS3736781.1 hypothetical protein [Mucilaginibacter dorajii]
MEELLIFRIFAAFPLFGLLLPDLSLLLVSPHRQIPDDHIYIEFFLLLSEFICTVGLWYAQKQQKNSSGNVKLSL